MELEVSGIVFKTSRGKLAIRMELPTIPGEFPGHQPAPEIFSYDPATWYATVETAKNLENMVDLPCKVKAIIRVCRNVVKGLLGYHVEDSPQLQFIRIDVEGMSEFDPNVDCYPNILHLLRPFEYYWGSVPEELW